MGRTVNQRLRPLGQPTLNKTFALSFQNHVALNPNDTDVFFDACVPGGGPVGPELENRFLH